ncbi:MAG: tetratricopeptide repeat protein [Planctomycetota bacterium]
MKVPPGLARVAREIDGWLDLGRAERALSLLPKLREHPGTRPFSLSCEVRALILLERFDDALSCLRELRHFEVDPVWLEVNEAWCYKRVDNLSAAIEAMQRLIDRAPEEAIGHYNLGCYLALRGESEQAIAALARAFAIDNDFREHAVEEHDLDSLRQHDAFRFLLEDDD